MRRRLSRHRQAKGDCPIFALVTRDPTFEAERSEEASADSSHEVIARQRHQRHAHPQGLEAGGGSIEREWIESDIDVVEQRQLLRPAEIGPQQHQALRANLPRCKAAKKHLLNIGVGEAVLVLQEQARARHRMQDTAPEIDYSIIYFQWIIA